MKKGNEHESYNLSLTAIVPGLNTHRKSENESEREGRRGGGREGGSKEQNRIPRNKQLTLRFPGFADLYILDRF